MYFHAAMSSTKLSTLTNPELEIILGTKEKKFINALKDLADSRDNRGKRHSLSILIVTVVFATLVNRSKVSSIHRYMNNKIHWLREITGIHDAKVISRSHFPRMLAKIDWIALSLIMQFAHLRKIKPLYEHRFYKVLGSFHKTLNIFLYAQIHCDSTSRDELACIIRVQAIGFTVL